MKYIIDSIDKGIIKAFKECLKKHDTRKNLCHVYYSKNDSCLYATDGHKLLKATFFENTDTSLVLPSHDCYGSIKGNDSILLDAELLTDIRYPNVEKLIPTDSADTYNILLGVNAHNKITEEIRDINNVVTHKLAAYYDKYNCMFNYQTINKITGYLKCTLHLWCYPNNQPCLITYFPTCRVFRTVDLLTMPMHK